jgi:threonine aldolase
MTTDGLLTRADCAYAIAGHAYVAPAEILRTLAQRGAAADRDLYGEGETLSAFERKIAKLLGKEAAVFMPSGTMAQQIALRIVADRTGRRTFAAHATSHVVIHEQDGYARLHDLTFAPAGGPFAPITLAAVRAIAQPLGTLLVELPQREIGGELSTWDELVAITGEARGRGWHVHLDGARLWECAPYYGKTYAEIAALFDTVYVSFYKGIGAVSGAMLLGPQSFIDEAKVWQRRHGGNLYSLFPYVFSAEQAFDERIGRMADYWHAAQRVAKAFAPYPDVTLRPNPPVTNMFHVFVRGSEHMYLERAQRLAAEREIWTISKLAPTPTPGVLKWEISCGDATVALNDAQLAAALDSLFTPAA